MTGSSRVQKKYYNLNKEADDNYSGHDGLSFQVKLYTFFLLIFQGLFRLAKNVLFAMFFTTLAKHVLHHLSPICQKLSMPPALL